MPEPVGMERAGQAFARLEAGFALLQLDAGTGDRGVFEPESRDNQGVVRDSRSADFAGRGASDQPGQGIGLTDFTAPVGIEEKGGTGKHEDQLGLGTHVAGRFGIPAAFVSPLDLFNLHACLLGGRTLLSNGRFYV